MSGSDDEDERMGTRLKGKVALITGAGMGMGREAAILFAEEGARLVVCDINKQAAEETVALVGKAGGEGLAAVGDVAVEEDVRRMVEEGARRFGALHVLYNNAGVLWKDRDRSVLETDEKWWDRVIAINLKSVFWVTKHGIPHLRRAGGGSIVNISSQLGLVGTDNSSPQYQASKGAVRLLTKATAIQYAREGIRANSVHPGPIVTAMTERRRADPAQRELMISRIPLGRYGEPDEVAYGVLYLASDESAFVTGSELVIDGGWTAQ